ncbi:hypothetical protein CPT_Saba_044 [Proteus phage Saba]|uniref:Uncharacterized protein n=1 Tax=Proteus phage Saba TaxID=2596672 RepID=A0A5B9N5E3_9CAUD|nr:hypothetical protein JT320_gp44 [Proteus phage Saba]QEG09417.1 hypothetical protein CPT_Saba_044 [Proteus phage Saba]
MLKHIDGFDHYADIGKKGSVVEPYLKAAGYDFRNATDETFAIDVGRRDGAKSLKFTVERSSSTNASLSWSFTPTGDYSCFGFALKANGSRMRVCRIENLVDLEWNSEDGKLEINDQKGVNPLILNAWYYFELECDKSAKTVTVWVNNEKQITANISDSWPEKMTIVWGQVGTAQNAGIQFIDDFYAMDSSGSVNTERLGPIEVATRAPTADVTKEWEIVNGVGSDHFKVAAQLEPGKPSAPYLQSNKAGAKDVFRSNAVLPTNNKVFGVSVVAYARKGDLDDRKLGMMVKTDGGQEKETQVPLTEDYKYYQITHEQTPGGTAWNKNNVESLEFGIITR